MIKTFACLKAIDLNFADLDLHPSRLQDRKLNNKQTLKKLQHFDKIGNLYKCMILTTAIVS